MEFSEIISAISAVGFPIVFCLLLWKTQKDGTTAHEKEINSLMGSIDKLTMAVQRLFDKLGGGDVNE